MGYQWQRSMSESTNDSDVLTRTGAVRTTLWRGSSVNGVIDTRYGAIDARLAVNLVGPHYFDGDNQSRQGTMPPWTAAWAQATERMNISVYVDNLLTVVTVPMAT